MGVQVCALGTSKKTEGDLCRRGPLAAHRLQAHLQRCGRWLQASGRLCEHLGR